MHGNRIQEKSSILNLVGHNITSIQIEYFRHFPAKEWLIGFKCENITHLEGTIWPNMIYLNISGNWTCHEVILKNFIQRHPKLKFLGLTLTNCEDKMAQFSNINITGRQCLKNILNCLKNNSLNVTAITTSLKSLCTTILRIDDDESNNSIYIDILQTICDILENWKFYHNYKKTESYHLIVHSLSSIDAISCYKKPITKLPISYRIVKLCFKILESFKTHSQIVNLCLGAIYRNYRGLGAVQNDFHSLSIILELGSQINDDSVLRQLYVACMTFFSKIRIHTTINPQDKNDVLAPIEGRLFTLLFLFLMTQNTKQIVMQDRDIISLVLERIEKHEFPVSQTAAANLAHILIIESECSSTIYSKEDVKILQTALLDKVNMWGDEIYPSFHIYSSFNGLIHLIKSNIIAVKKWALWTLRNLLLNNRRKYSTLAIRDGVLEVLDEIIVHPDEHNLNRIVTDILNILVKKP
ncbi:DgyrCDS5263 [Dimorphilus gyrociliatus]|uniref:DgyrCDS5263 n=1 Tax=Dimorphilus gyrociliatus TaxID=2664684 RepID=A0A7I8VJA4_9ANNE|nr:DgyrCDS5263 [Dimorphilus gyrociliatus]